MAHYYGDSSALAKRHLPETGTAWLRALIAPETGAVVVTSRISIVEVVSALNRRVREATLNLADYSVLVADFEGLCAAEHGTIELGPTVVTRARVLLERHPLRSHDAIQLSSALMANETLLAAGLPGLVFLCVRTNSLRARHNWRVSLLRTRTRTRRGRNRRAPGSTIHVHVTCRHSQRDQWPASASSTWEAVYEIVRQIPPRRVMTYGQISRLLDGRISPRYVGFAMHVCPEDVPWQRVVNASGGCSTDRVGGSEKGLQRFLLEMEGVEFRPNGAVRLETYRWEP